MPIRSLCKKAWNQPLALAVDRPGGLSPPKGPAPSEAVRLALRTLVRRTADALLLCAAMAAALHGLQLDRAQELYQRTQYREALRLLEASREKTAAIYDLLGKCYYRLEEFSKATDAFEKAVAAEPRNALFWNWLGKAYGRRAETSVFFNQPRYAVRAREHFEKAVSLDPQNREALSDLFEYYLEAPGFLGGGLEKAADLSERIRNLDPARYQAMQARLAEKRKDFAQAEQFWRRAVELAPAEPGPSSPAGRDGIRAGRLADLARFLARQKRFPESDAAFEQAAKLAPDKADLKFSRAQTYLDSKRNQDLARRLLEEYLKSSLTPDDPPRAEAERLLRSIGRTG